MSELRIKGSWGGWRRDQVIELTDGSVWRQIDDRYEWRFAHKPVANVENGIMQVEGMKNSAKVARVK